MCREVTKGDNNKSFVPPETRGEELLNKAAEGRTRVKSERLIDKPEKKCLEADFSTIHSKIFLSSAKLALQSSVPINRGKLVKMSQ